MTEKLSPQDRLRLLRTLNGLPSSIFEEVRIGVGAPKQVLPGDGAEPGKRSAALMDWADSKVGCGEVKLKQVVDEVVAHHRGAVSPPAVSSVSNISVLEQDLQVKLPNNTLLELVHIPSGVFYMGSPTNEEGRYGYEGPQHRVKMPGFYMGKYPITQAQWYAVSLLDEVEQTLSPRPSYFKGDHRPVEKVNWYEAMEFCNRLSVHTGQQYRLPSEAEWEYACRAGTSSRYSFGEDITWDQVNCRIEKKKIVDGVLGIGRREIVEETSRGKTTEVGSFLSNAFGLCDMHGNVWEWCLDHWHDSYDSSPSDGSAWIEGGNSNRRVKRGGSWFNDPRLCRSAYRRCSTPDFRSRNLGIRVVLAPR